jgi:nucleoside-diphosphate-sugar epimerase
MSCGKTDGAGRGSRVALRRLLRSGDRDEPGSGCGDGCADPQASVPHHRRRDGVWSFVHLEDAAAATAIAVEHGQPGVYNVVDDEPAPVREWLPVLASALGARPPRRIPRWLGRLAAGEVVTRMMTEARSAANEKAKREFGWQLRYPSWRQGFAHGLG